MNISAHFGDLDDLGLYMDRFDISDEILQNISKSLYFKHIIEKKLLARRFR